MKKLLLSLGIFFTLVLGGSLNAYADTGVDFGASEIKVGTAGYGVIDGRANGKFYHLTPSNAGIYVNSLSTSTDPDTGKIRPITVTLRKGRYAASKICTVTVTATGWYQLPGITKDDTDYSLYLVYSGASGSVASISGTVHDHGYAP